MRGTVAVNDEAKGDPTVSHHSPREADEKFAAVLEKVQGLESLQQKLRTLDQELKDDPGRRDLGPTGRFPDGRLTPSDEGEFTYRVGAKAGQVVIDFGKPVAWIGFDADSALELARTIKKHARRARAQELAEAS